MNNSDFVHLHVHSEYSLLDGLGKPEQYVEKAKELGFQALAITDHGNIDGHLQWQKACQKFGMRSILGCELYLVSDMKSKEKKDPRGHVILLVKDLSGWQALTKMLTLANLEGFYYRPRLDFKTLLSNINNGLIVMTGCANSFLLMPEGVELLIELGKNKRIDCYLEVMPHQMEDQKKVNELCCDLSQKYDLPLVASNDCHYIRSDHTKAQEVLLAIQRQAKWRDKDRWRFEIDGLHLKTADEMIQAFRDQSALSRTDYHRAMANTLEVARKCWDFQLPKKDMDLPLTHYEREKPEMSSAEILDWLTRDRRALMVREKSWSTDYSNRYDREMNLIEEKGFTRYFLMVYEVVQWCKKQGIMIGPGRGSVGGSLVAYLLDMTQVDPLRYNLLFERFISDDRIDYPDIDLDFEDIKCYLVRRHLEEEYGKYNVVGISTFLRMKGRAVVRDVGRVFDLPTNEIDFFAKSIRQGDHEEGVIAIEKEGKEGHYFSQKYPKEFQLMTILEGTIRGAGQHPAGLVLSAKDLRSGENCNICQRAETLVCNWDMDDCEYNGLVKVDILKLGTLTVLNEAKRLLNLRNVHISYEKLPLDDRGIFDMLSQGDTSGVFQFTGYACTELCKRMEIDSFEDMAAVTALARPGPAESGMTDLYVRRKKGGKWSPLHPAYEAITKETYGVIIYQEQMMRAMTDLAGLSNSDADQIRKVIGKKRRPEEFDPYKKSFLEGCRKRKTLTPDQAQEFWKGLLEWASYGFSKCLTGDTELCRSSFNQYSGRYVKLKDLYLSWNQQNGSQYWRRGLDVIQMDDDERCRPGKVIGVYYQGRRSVFEVVTQTGKRIKGTSNHPFFTFDGYRRISDLVIGDRLAVTNFCQEPTAYQKKGQVWKSIDTKGKVGFQKGKENPTYIDGRQRCLEIVQSQVLKRSKGKCERCFKKRDDELRFEFAHIISPVGRFGGDYSKYHSVGNMLYLCNSCHKILDHEKKERKKRYEKGYSIFYDPIVSIKELGEEEVFDVEMEGPNHNFIANGIISHNSHAIEYAMIGYWTAFLKLYYPVEFFCAQLTYGADKGSIVKEVERAGMVIVTPKVGISDGRRWIVKNERLYMPFIEIKGIGVAQADKCASMRFPSGSSSQGFFKIKITPGIEAKGKLEKLLGEVCAFDPDPSIMPKNCLDYFQYPISGHGDTREGIVILNRRAILDHEAKACTACELRKQAHQVILSSLGIYNVLVFGESPGRDEDKEGMGFVGDAGQLLWEELYPYRINRRMLHVGNVCRCWPSRTRTPSKDEINECFKRWMISEIRSMDCRLILAMGNIPLYALTGKDSGITSLSGQVEWIEKVRAWVVWCVHPAAVLRNRSSNIDAFQKGIEAFAETFNNGIKR